MPRRKTKQGEGMSCIFKAEWALLIGWRRWHLNNDWKEWINGERGPHVGGLAYANSPGSSPPCGYVAGVHSARGREYGMRSQREEGRLYSRLWRTLPLPRVTRGAI